MSTRTKNNADAIAETLHHALVSPNVADSNGEAANLVDVVHELARAVGFGLKWLGTGDAMTQMGAIEAHGVMVKEAAETIAAAISDLASAIRETHP
jgi:hypothetical protein